MHGPMNVKVIRCTAKSRPSFDPDMHGINGGQNITEKIFLQILWSFRLSIIPAMLQIYLISW